MTVAEIFYPPPPAKATPGGVLLPVDMIDAVGRVRETTEAAVAQMADSIVKSGLISPLLVRPIPDGRYRLVLGGHRLAAVRLLGLDQVRCEIRDLDDDEALSLELEENLCRSELNQLDFAIFCMEREALDERIKLRPKAGGDRQSATGKAFCQVDKMVPRFTKELAEKVGRGERQVYRAIEMAKALDPEAIATIRGTKLADNQSQLLTLSRMPPAQQRAAARDYRDGLAKTIAAARDALQGLPTQSFDPQQLLLRDLNVAWDKCEPATRLEFLASIDAVFISKAAEQAAPTPRRGGRR